MHGLWIVGATLLADLRILNGEGIAVAHQFTSLQQNAPSSEFSVDVISIPVEADVQGFSGSSQVNTGKR